MDLLEKHANHVELNAVLAFIAMTAFKTASKLRHCSLATNRNKCLLPVGDSFKKLKRSLVYLSGIY